MYSESIDTTNESGYSDAERDNAVCFDKDAVIGWDNSLAIGVSTRSKLISAAIGVEEIMLESFHGKGAVILQSANVRVPRNAFSVKGKGSPVDYLNAVVGIR